MSSQKDSYFDIITVLKSSLRGPKKWIKFSKELYKLAIVSKVIVERIELLDFEGLQSETVMNYLLQRAGMNIICDSHSVQRVLTALASVEPNVLENLTFLKLQKKLSKLKAGFCDEAITVRNTPFGGVDRVNMTIPALANFLAKISHKWEMLATLLGFPKNVIEDCRTNNNAESLCNILHEFAYETECDSVTLQSLVKALSSELIGEPILAKKLADHFKQHVDPVPTTKSTYFDWINLTYQSGDLEITDGKSVILEVQMNASSRVSFYWKKMNTILNDDSTYSGTRTNMLFIKQVRPGVGGEYFCTIKSDCGEIQSGFMNLSIKYSFQKKRLLNQYGKCAEIPKRVWPGVGTKSYINLALFSTTEFFPHYNYYEEVDEKDRCSEVGTDLSQDVLFGNYNNGSLLWICGKAGCGKTTLLHKLIKAWSITGNVLRGSKLLFFISLEVFTQLHSIVDVLKLYYPNKKEQKKVKNDLELSDGEGCCLLIDGLEASHMAPGNADSVIHQLLYKSYLPEAMVIVATRPSLTVWLQNVPVTRVIEVIGFSKNQVHEYIINYPFHFKKETNSEMAQNLIHYLTLHHDILGMCCLPVNLSMFCFLFKSKNGKFPFNETQIYEEFTRCIVLQTLIACNEKLFLNNVEDLEGRRKREFDKTCKLAFIMTLNSMKVIHHQEISAIFSEEDCCNITFSLGQININRSSQYNSLVDIYSFLHITLQEYLCAYYIYKHNLLLSAYPELPSKPKMVVSKFYCGIVIMLDEKKDELVTLFKDIFHSKESYICGAHCAFETQQSLVCNYIVELGRGCLDLSGASLSLIDITAIAFIISAASLPIYSLKISSCSISDIKLNVLLRKRPNLKSLRVLDAHSKGFGSSGAKELSGSLWNSNNLVCLNLSNNKIGSIGAAAVANVIANNNSLQTLSLAYNDIHYDGAAAIAKALENCFNLCYLELSYNHIMDKGVEALRNAMKCCQKLEHLLLIDTCINSEGASVLAEGLKDLICLKSLDLSQNKISSLGAIELATTFKNHNPNLRYLFLGRNSIGSCGAAALAEGLSGSKVLQTLNLEQNCITFEGAIALSALIANSEELKSLSIACNNIAFDGARILIEALRCSNLMSLELNENPIGYEEVIALKSYAHSITTYIEF